MMHQSSQPSVQTVPAQKQIPQHVLDRFESEWKQMRESTAPQPVAQR